MITQTYGASDFQARLAAAGGAIQAGVPQALYQPLGVLFQADVRQQFYTGVGSGGVAFQRLRHARPNGGDKPLLNTGILANSYVAAVDPRGVEVSSSHPGAAVHQAGAVIRPVRAKALTIPLTTEAMRYGPRRFPRKLFPVGRFLCEGVGEGKERRLIRHYLFAAEVTVPARPVDLSDRAIGEATETLVEYWLARL